MRSLMRNWILFKQIGMTTHLAQTRSNGLLAMVKQMKNYALAYKIKNATSVTDHGYRSIETKSN